MMNMYQEQIKSKTPTSTKLLSFGTKNSCDISYGLYKVSLKGTSLLFTLKLKINAKKLLLISPIHPSS